MAFLRCRFGIMHLITMASASQMNAEMHHIGTMPRCRLNAPPDFGVQFQSENRNPPFHGIPQMSIWNYAPHHHGIRLTNECGNAPHRHHAKMPPKRTTRLWRTIPIWKSKPAISWHSSDVDLELCTSLTWHPPHKWMRKHTISPPVPKCRPNAPLDFQPSGEDQRDGQVLGCQKTLNQIFADKKSLNSGLRQPSLWQSAFSCPFDLRAGARARGFQDAHAWQVAFPDPVVPSSTWWDLPTDSQRVTWTKCKRATLATFFVDFEKQPMYESYIKDGGEPEPIFSQHVNAWWNECQVWETKKNGRPDIFFARVSSSLVRHPKSTCMKMDVKLEKLADQMRENIRLKNCSIFLLTSRNGPCMNHNERWRRTWTKLQSTR